MTARWSNDGERQKVFDTVRSNLAYLQEEIEKAALSVGRNPVEVRMLAATKTVPAELINYAIGLGVRLIGENRAQELIEKYDSLCLEGVENHFIGHLQTNKVGQVVGRVSTIESVDSLHLAREISKKSQACNLTTKVFIEVNIGGEDSKSGIAPAQCEALIEEISQLKGIQITGLMTIPPISSNSMKNRQNFSLMRQLFVDIQGKKIDNVSMDFLSMGMSGDFREAILEGANIVRIGSALFGARV